MYCDGAIRYMNVMHQVLEVDVEEIFGSFHKFADLLHKIVLSVHEAHMSGDYTR